MKLDLGSFAFNSSITSGGNTPSWGTALGQGEGYKVTCEDRENIILGMTRQFYPKDNVYCPFGKGGRCYSGKETDEIQQVALFRKVFVNDTRVDYPFILLIQHEQSGFHAGRLSLKYSPKIHIKDDDNHILYSNAEFIKRACSALSIREEASWFVYDIDIANQDTLILTAGIVDGNNPKEYNSPEERKREWLELIPKEKKVRYIEEEKQDFDSLQRIYYGAPGVGKSHKVDQEAPKDKTIRTTFHPDSDYSTFVGAYKPTMERYLQQELAVVELKAKLFDLKKKGETYPCQKFGAQYWYSLSKLQPSEIEEIVTECDFSTNYTVEVNKGMAVGKYMPHSGESRIIYEFVPQAFLKAYIEAWKNYPDPQYLVIEEINRGNCAQIFGDIFQLLDRDDEGYSKFPIAADNDIRKYILSENLALESCELDDAKKSKIRSGEILLLPNNLYIWATMNTSDQSLFPIDSAFKRRWDWKYMRIEDAGKGWCISVENNLYNWWNFLESINKHIYETTNSADKQLGYFFCRARNKIVSTETFVNKVLFYLWNDVFKDYGFDDAIFNDEKDGKLTFDSFFNKDDGEKKVARFLENLGVKKESSANTSNNSETSTLEQPQEQ